MQFLCYAVDASGNVVVARATVNDYGTPELAPVDGSALPATTLAAADDPTTATYQGTGNATVAIDPVVGITLVAVTTTGSGPFTVQPEQASAPVGPPMLDTTAPVTGRYFAGTAGPFSSFAVTAQGDWTIRIQRLSSALALTATTPVTAVQPDVASYADTTALDAHTRSRRSRTADGDRCDRRRAGDVAQPAGPVQRTAPGAGGTGVRQCRRSRFVDAERRRTGEHYDVGAVTATVVRVREILVDAVAVLP